MGDGRFERSAGALAWLKSAGFDPTTVQYILGTKLGLLFAPRYQEVEATAGTNAVARQEAYMKIALERHALWEKLMWDPLLAGGLRPSASDRRSYGDLPREKIEQLKRIERDYREMESQLERAVKYIYLPGDREQVDYLQREKNDFADRAGATRDMARSLIALQHCRSVVAWMASLIGGQRVGDNALHRWVSRRSRDKGEQGGAPSWANLFPGAERVRRGRKNKTPADRGPSVSC